MNTTIKSILPAALIAVGLFAIGSGVKAGLGRIAEGSRQVTVRGLAERNVDADHVTWPVVYRVIGNDLEDIYGQIKKCNDEITQYIESGGLTSSEISVVAPEITDKYANQYGNERYSTRYIAKSVVVVSTDKVASVDSLIANSASLLKSGIVIDTNDYGNRVEYEFTGLNDIKPEMIAEATKSARAAADKFAADSHSKIGKIVTATQGSFTIEDRDAYTPYIKYVRVVTSITYTLEN